MENKRTQLSKEERERRRHIFEMRRLAATDPQMRIANALEVLAAIRILTTEGHGIPKGENQCRAMGCYEVATRVQRESADGTWVDGESGGYCKKHDSMLEGVSWFELSHLDEEDIADARQRLKRGELEL